ncbi:Uncharacterised protein [BD1-7 clade bacterium]|uniref:TonB-dependent receptor plug domain-containing protein n=1 Tax=BD1-7 clade bacterium TaxID=2029982 RepID=A0A5S9QXQ0_9GAMM|nr:Uncharacterised protein [BD1-7 clade bacterium]
MIKSLLSRSVAIGLSCYASTALSGDMVLYMFKDGAAAEGFQVAVNGSATKPVKEDGSVTFNLGGGDHEAVLTSDQGEELMKFRFTAAADQNADISIDVEEGEEPEVLVETYSVNENDAQRAEGVQGGVGGEVYDSDSDAVIAGATIKLIGTSYEGVADEEGYFEFSAPRGVYTAVVSHPDYGSREIQDFRVVSLVDKQVNFALSKFSDDIEEVEVVAKYNPDSFTDTERFSLAVVDSISIEQLARFGDSDAASAVKRIAGVAVEGGKYVVVRGLNPRHSSVMLNGASLPSPDPTRRNVPLDLFPSTILDAIDVQKSFSPSVYGDSTGGTVKLTTRSFPDEFEGKFSTSLGLVTDLTGESREVQQGEALDFFGFGSEGDRKIPSDVEANLEELNDSDLEGAERTDLSLSMPHTLATEKRTIAPDVKLELSIGDTFFDTGDVSMGYLAAVKFKNSWRSEVGKRNNYSLSLGGGLVEDDNIDYVRTTNDIDLGAGFTLGMNIGEDHDLASNTLWLRQTTADTFSYDASRFGDQDRPTKGNDLRWFEREFVFQQFTGTHYIPSDLDTTITWQTSFSSAKLDEPDGRSYAFEERGDEYELIISDVERKYSELDDTNVDFSVGGDSALMKADDAEMRLKYGLSSFKRERNSSQFSIGYGTNSNGSGGDLPDEYEGTTDIDQILNKDTIAGGDFFINSRVPASGTYSADWNLNAAYLSLDYNQFDMVRVDLGVRFESSKMTVDTFKSSNSSIPVQAEVDDNSLLPSLNVTVPIGDMWQLRGAYYETINRPDFRELSAASYVDPESGETFVGNPDLVSAEIQNFDIRAEFYPSDNESVSLAIFHKDFDNPIEKVLEQGNAVFSFENGSFGKLSGVEFDFRLEYDIAEYGVFVSGNYTYIDSEVEVQSGSSIRKQKMQGQPDDLVNFQLGFDDFNWGMEYTLVYFRQGETLYSLGADNYPNIVLEARNDLGFNVSKNFGEESKLTLKTKNLLNEPFEQTQGGENYRSYKTGVSVELAYSLEF